MIIRKFNVIEILLLKDSKEMQVMHIVKKSARRNKKYTAFSLCLFFAYSIVSTPFNTEMLV